MSQKINAIVFSSDRAAQLKIFLDSVYKNAPEVFDLNVIYSYTSSEHQSGYSKILEDYKYADVNFLSQEADFKEQVVKIIKESGELFSFFLDDDIIYREVKLADVSAQIESDDDIACFSLRLGENTTHCYTLGTNNVLHDIQFDGELMKWDWSLHYLDFGYPFAMDGHIFRKSDILKLVKKSSFICVEELEMALFDFAEMFPRNKMASYRQSALVGVPIGRVQQSIEEELSVMLKNGQARIIREKMNEKFLSDTFINLESIDFSYIDGCHQELNLGVELKESMEEAVSEKIEDANERIEKRIEDFHEKNKKNE
jgi:hypothetical protein